MANRSDRCRKTTKLHVAPLLRLYWFRLEDALVPAGTGAGRHCGLSRLQASRPVLANWLLVRGDPGWPA